MALGLAAASAIGLGLLALVSKRLQAVPLDGLVDTVGAALRATGAACLMFVPWGLGVVRLALPEGLRRYEWLWVLPVGACTSAIVLTLLGFAAAPFTVNLVLTLAAGAAVCALALRRRGLPARPDLPGGLAAYLAVLVAAAALFPYVLAGFPTVIGVGSDAHLAAGTGEFLRHSYPTSVNADLPVDEMPLVWRSKHPIYYVLGGVASLSGLETWEALAPVIALMLGLALVGVFLLARELLDAGPATALAAAAAAGLDRMVLHTGMHPYYNQTWGYFAVPFALVLSWWAVRRPSRGAAGLLTLFLAICAFAYPLALPVPGLALVVLLWLERRKLRLPRLYRGRRSLLWMVPVGLLLAVPVFGVIEKMVTASWVVLDPGASLTKWGGDLFDFIPANQFFAIPFRPGWWLMLIGLLVLALLALRRLPREIALAIGAVLGTFLLAGAYFRSRDHGWYFEFKALAFVGPLLVACAVVGASRLRPAGPAIVGVIVLLAAVSGNQELKITGHQLQREVVDLRKLDAALPPDASVRLDVPGNEQLWVAYMLSSHPLCSITPLLGTSYPHVQFSRRADYVLLDKVGYPGARRPVDPVGPPLVNGRRFALFRLQPHGLGPDRCSRRMVQTYSNIPLAPGKQ